MTHRRFCLNPMLLLLLGLVPLYGIDCGGGGDDVTGGTGGEPGPPTVTCANFNQQNVDFLQCSFDEVTEECKFYIQFFEDGMLEKTCRDHCEGVVGGTCISAEDEESKEGDARCQGSGFVDDCDEDFNSVICTCTLNTGGTGGTAGACDQRLDFDLVCPGNTAVGATGQITVEGYDAANINQLTFGAAGDGTVNPPAFQVPDPADSNTNVPPPPYVFTFTALGEGEVILSVVTFDLSENDCSLVKTCNFDVVP